MDIANFQKTILKTYLKTCKFKVHCTKTAIYEQFEIFLKTMYNTGFKIFRGTFAYKLCPKKISLRRVNIKNTRNIFKIVQERPLLTLLYWSQNFETKTL